MKTRLFFLMTLLSLTGVAQITLINDGAHLFMDTGIVTTVQGNIVNQNNGVMDNDGTLKISSDFTNTATFDQDTGLVIFNGSGSAQNIWADTSTFYFLDVDNSAGVRVVSGATRVRHTLTLLSGSYVTNDSLVLLSDENRTARIAEIPSGSNVIGDIVMQRYLDMGVTGWHNIGTATSGGTLAEWNDDILTTGFTGSDFPSFAFNNIYSYKESVSGKSDQGYVAATNITDNINSGQGYWTYIGPVPLTLDSKGPAHTFGQALPIDYNNTSSGVHDGWNLVANPYPSNINWNASGWTKINVDNAIYTYDPDAGVYASYVAGVGSNGGTQYIASSQGFWVKTNASSPILTLTEPVKTEVEATFFRKKADLSSAPLLRLQVSSTLGGLSDETILAFSPLANGSWNSQFDAYKLEDIHSFAPYIATLLDTVDLSVNALPEVANEGGIPLRIKVKSTGDYAINIQREGQLPMGNCLYLEDLDNDSITDLKTHSTYSFHIADTTVEPRFLIHTNPKVDLGKDTFVVSGESILLDAGEGFVAYSWSNGETSRTITVQDSGTYSVQVRNQFGCVGEDEITVGLDSVTGIGSKTNPDIIAFNIYPNPTKDRFYIPTSELKEGKYVLQGFSSTGQLVFEQNYQVKKEHELITADVSRIAAGQYYFTLIGQSYKLSSKVTIIR